MFRTHRGENIGDSRRALRTGIDDLEQGQAFLFGAIRHLQEPVLLKLRMDTWPPAGRGA